MKSDILIEPEPDVLETETPPKITKITDSSKIIFDNCFNEDRRIRQAVYGKILTASQKLPSQFVFVIYEAYRTHQRQIDLWNQVWRELKKTYPNDGDETLALRANRFVANPYKHGSGHQYGCAIDITIRDLDTGQDLDMGCAMQEFCEVTETLSPLVTSQQMDNRILLKDTLEAEGLINYPPEWWHFSYGDRQWAIQKGFNETLYATLPF